MRSHEPKLTEHIFASLFGILVLSTILTITEIYIFLSREDSVRDSLTRLVTSGIQETDGNVMRGVAYDFLRVFDSSEDAREGYKKIRIFFDYYLVVVDDHKLHNWE